MGEVAAIKPWRVERDGKGSSAALNGHPLANIVLATTRSAETILEPKSAAKNNQVIFSGVVL
jgi:hypothetical protein